VDLKVFLRLDGSGFSQGITKVRQALGTFKAQLAGAFSVGAVTYGIKRMLDFADSIDETASRLGVGTRALQEWTFAAQQAGVSSEKLQGFIERLSAAAADGNKSKLFAAIGVDPNQTPEALFRSVQAKTQGKTPTEVIKMLADIIGDFRQIGPMINLLTGDLNAAGESARKLGAVIDDATIKHLANLNDQIAIVSQVLMGNFAPALITAGKAAISAFSYTKGASGYWGARTANFSAKDIAKIIALNAMPGGAAAAQAYIHKKIKEGDAMGLGKMAADERDKALKELDEMLKKIDAYTAPSLPAITASNASNEQRKIARGASAGGGGDSLVSFGNFLGAGRSNIDTIARETNRILKEHTVYLRQIAQKNITLDIGVP
jgi:hypothetical protein